MHFGDKSSRCSPHDAASAPTATAAHPAPAPSAASPVPAADGHAAASPSTHMAAEHTASPAPTATAHAAPPPATHFAIEHTASPASAASSHGADAHLIGVDANHQMVNHPVHGNGWLEPQQGDLQHGNGAVGNLFGHPDNSGHTDITGNGHGAAATSHVPSHTFDAHERLHWQLRQPPCQNDIHRQFLARNVITY